MHSIALDTQQNRPRATNLDKGWPWSRKLKVPGSKTANRCSPATTLLTDVGQPIVNMFVWGLAQVLSVKWPWPYYVTLKTGHGSPCDHTVCNSVLRTYQIFKLAPLNLRLTSIHSTRLYILRWWWWWWWWWRRVNRVKVSKSLGLYVLQ